MKNFLLVLLVIVMAGGLYAQNKKTSTLIGFQVGTVAPMSFSNASMKNVKIGLPTFSYAASLEKRFSLHTKLNFSFQYSLNYLRINKAKSAETDYYLKNSGSNFSSSLNLITYYNLNKRTALYAGFGVSQSFSSYLANKSSAANNKTFSLSDFNPTLILGIEKSTRLFNKNLYYSLQYNMGFFPLSQQIRTESKDVNTPSRMHGVHFGLKYKY